MCGIVGYVGFRPVVPVLLGVLRNLEYRGYDSAGIALKDKASGSFQVFKKTGKLQNLQQSLPATIMDQTGLGIGHTRWATHGGVTEENAHPHLGGSKLVAVIHNGIFENYQAIRTRLEKKGSIFVGQTDTEVFAHFVEEIYLNHKAETLKAHSLEVLPPSTLKELFVKAVREALQEMKGAYAIVVTHKETDTVVAARTISPLVIGLGNDENFLASDASALKAYTNQFIYMENGDVAVISPQHVEMMNLSGEPIERIKVTQEFASAAASEEMGDYPHHMLREIYQQPQVIQNLIQKHTDSEHHLTYASSVETQKIKRIILIACGTSFHAAMYGKYTLETLAEVPTEVRIASEFLSSKPLIDSSVLVITLSQSGETADTLEALRCAKARGAQCLGIVNVPFSTMTREVDDSFYLEAGTEKSVASTKAFTGMLIALSIISIWMGKKLNKLEDAGVEKLVAEMKKLPELCQILLDKKQEIDRIAKTHFQAKSMLFFGRGEQHSIAIEGALKMKEISYIHAEGFALGEIKHGPIALIDSELPSVVIATDNASYRKVVSNIHEIKARKGQVVAIATDGDEELKGLVDDIVFVPNVHEMFAPVINVLPLQLLAYEVAVLRGNDVDFPRNLAKSVTVL